MATYKLVDSDQLDTDLTTVADAIREKTGGTEPLSFPEGMAGEVDAVYEAGKKAEYDAFWDAYQNNGVALDYSRAFSSMWTVDIFRPKYDIIATSAYMIFGGNRMKIDLVKYLADLGVSLDLSQAVNTQYMFQATAFTRIGVVDVRASTNSRPLDTAFANSANLVSIDKIYLKTGTAGEFNNTFAGCIALENVEFEGEIANDGLNMGWSQKLSKASILSILNALSTTSTDKTVTFSMTAVNNAFETSEGSADGSTSEEWTTIIATKPNWTIALAGA